MVFLIDSIYKTNKYRLLLLDIIGVTSIGMIFSVAFSYLDGEYLNNFVWALQRFWGLFLRRDAPPEVIVVDRNLTLMNAVKTIFPEATNSLCQFHIDKNVKAKCKTLVGKKMHEIMSWKPEGVWWIVLLSKSFLSALRSLKLFADHGQCLLTMSTKNGWFPTKKDLLKPGWIRWYT